jgi:hypothetical protein
MTTERRRQSGLVASFSRQFARPEGVGGRLAGWIMARENVGANRLVVERLGIAAAEGVEGERH